jgi:hypothetical protein
MTDAFHEGDPHGKQAQCCGNRKLKMAPMAFANKPGPRILPPAAEGLDGVLDAALAIAEKRREMLARLRQAVKTNDVAEVFRAARELIADDEKSDRANSGKHEGPSSR